MNNLLAQSKLFLSRNGSTILTGAGAIGFVVTTIMAIKATPKAMDLLEKAKQKKGEDLTKIEKVKVAVPVYIPTVITGVSTLACMFGANALNKRSQASLMSAYALIDRSYKDYKNKVEDIYGEEVHENVKAEIAKDRYSEVADIALSPDKQLFYDEFSGRYFESTIEDVQRAEYRLNRDIHMAGWTTLNDFYELLDVEPFDGSDALGWSEGGNLARYWQGWIDFNHHKVTMDDGLECYIVSFFQEPYVDWDEYS